MSYNCYLGGVLMPVTPAKLTIKVKGKNKTLELLNGGEINFLRAPGLTEITLPLTFPMLTGARRPDYYLNILEKAAYDLANSKQSPATTLAGYGIGDAYTKSEVDGLVSSALHYKGTKENYSDLPQSGNKVGDVWNITNASTANGINAGDNVAWNGSSWDVLAGTVDLSAYMLTSDVAAITNAEIDTICV